MTENQKTWLTNLLNDEIEEETIATGYDALGRHYEMRDCKEVGYKYTPMGHIPSPNDKRFRYVIFRDGNCAYVGNDYETTISNLRSLTEDSKWYERKGSMKII